MYIIYCIMGTVYRHIDYFAMINKRILSMKLAILYQMDRFQKFFLPHFALDGLNVVHELLKSLNFRKYDTYFLFYFFHFIKYQKQQVLIMKFKHKKFLKIF